MANESIERYPVGKRITGYCSTDITGCRFVVLTADVGRDGEGNNYSIAPAGRNAVAFGVAHRTMARGLTVGVNRGIVCDVEAGGTVRAGDLVSSDASGRAVVATPINFGTTTDASPVLGIACTGGASGELIEVALD